MLLGSEGADGGDAVSLGKAKVLPGVSCEAHLPLNSERDEWSRDTEIITQMGISCVLTASLAVHFMSGWFCVVVEVAHCPREEEALAGRGSAGAKVQGQDGAWCVGGTTRRAVFLKQRE